MPRERVNEDLLSPWISGAASAAELAELAIANIERLNPAINAVITPMPDAARAAAAACDAARARGETLGPVHGMPITLKDNVDTTGVRTTSASRVHAERVPDSDAEIVRRLARAGAVIVGKANLHELVLGATSQSAWFGPCRNPWDASRVPGGSSGGSDASVAAQMCVGSIGSDTGGSIRNPAAFANVAGLKATHGRVPNRGTQPVSPAHDCVGPLAARVADIARIYAAIAGYDPEDPTSEDRPLGDPLAALDDGVAGLRVGVPRGYYFEDLDPQVEAGVEVVIAVLESLGATRTQIELADAAVAWRLASTVLVMTDAAELHEARLRETPQAIGADVRAHLGRARGERHRLRPRAALPRALAPGAAPRLRRHGPDRGPDHARPRAARRPERRDGQDLELDQQVQLHLVAGGRAGAQRAVRVHLRRPAVRDAARGAVVVRGAPVPGRCGVSGRHRLAPAPRAGPGRRRVTQRARSGLRQPGSRTRSEPACLAQHPEQNYSSC